MKTATYILKYGTHEDILDLARTALADAEILSDSEALAFVARVTLARSFIEQFDDLELELKIMSNSLYVSGSSKTFCFTV